MTITTYRDTFLRTGFAGIFFFLAGIWFLWAPITPESLTILIRVLGAFGLILGIGACLIPFVAKVEISDEKIVQSGFNRHQATQWRDVKSIKLTGDPDFPSTRHAIHLRSTSGQLIVIVYSGFSRPYEFLRDVLRHLPSTCDIDPDLIGFAEKGKRYQWNLFVKNQLKFVVVGLSIIAILVLLIISGVLRS